MRPSSANCSSLSFLPLLSAQPNRWGMNLHRRLSNLLPRRNYDYYDWAQQHRPTGWLGTACLDPCSSRPIPRQWVGAGAAHCSQHRHRSHPQSIPPSRLLLHDQAWPMAHRRGLLGELSPNVPIMLPTSYSDIHKVAHCSTNTMIDAWRSLGNGGGAYGIYTGLGINLQGLPIVVATRETRTLMSIF